MSRRTRKSKHRQPARDHESRQLRKRYTRSLKKHQKFRPRATAGIIWLRHLCHQTFDLLWCGPHAPMTRHIAYAWLRDRLGLSEYAAHIRMLDAEQCRAVIRLVRDEYGHLFRHRA